MHAQILPSGFLTQRIARLNYPVHMSFLPDGRVLIAEQQGYVRVFKNGALLPGNALLLDSVYYQNEKGLLGIAVDRNFTATGHVFFYYTINIQGNSISGVAIPGAQPILYKIARYTMQGDVFVPSSKFTVIDLEKTPSFMTNYNHDGGQMEMGPDGKLYVAIGDAELWCSSSCMNMFSTSCNCGPTWIPPTYSDERGNYLCKLLRINTDGTAPPDNPYYSSPMPVTPQQKYFMATGLRNPFVLSFKANTNQIIIGDVGSAGAAQREEINILTVGGTSQHHLGFPHVEGIVGNPSYKDPTFAYPSGTTTSSGCAIVGGTYHVSVPGGNWPPLYTNKYFYMDLCNGYINSLDIDNGNILRNFVRNLATNIGHAVSGDGNIGLNSGPDGNMYYLTRSPTASVVGIYRISYQPITVTSISINASTNVISICGSTILLSTNILPANSTYQSAAWSATPSTLAHVSNTGLVTPLGNGVVTITARAVGNYAMADHRIITISGQSGTPQITVSGTAGANTVGIGGTLQMLSNASPTCQGTAVIWSITPITGSATINTSGLVSGLTLGTVRVTATLATNSTITGTFVLTVVGGCTNTVTGLTLTVPGSASITTDKGAIQVNPILLPSNACNTSVNYSVIGTSGCASATVNGTGLVTATLGNGLVTILGASVANPSVTALFVISISGQIIAVTNVSVNGTGGIKTISTPSGTLQMVSSITPTCATNSAVNWSVNTLTGNAWINVSSGMLTAAGNGIVNVIATSVSNPGVTGSAQVTISGQCSASVSAVNITASGGSAVINVNKGTLQLGTVFTPAFVCNNAVSWSVTGVSGCANGTISGAGLLGSTGGNGNITVTGTSVANTSVKGNIIIVVSNQIVSVTGVSASGQGGINVITVPSGILNMVAVVAPSCATNPSVTWSVVNGTGSATVNSTTGVLTASGNGIVTVTATSVSNPAIGGNVIINISGQCSPTVTALTLQSVGNLTVVSPGTNVLFYGSFTPSFVCNTTVGYVVTAVSGLATGSVNSSGLLTTGGGNGTISVIGVSLANTSARSLYVLTLNTGFVQVTSVIVTASGGSLTINSPNGTLQFGTVITPSNATNPNVTWSILTVSGNASVSASGLVTATGNGIVTVRATSNSNPTITGTANLTITGQCSPTVSNINITSAGTSINTAGGALQLGAVLSPAFVCNPAVTWSVLPTVNCASATISGSGMLQSTGGNGVVTLVCTSVATPTTTAVRIVSISGQNIIVSSFSIVNAMLLITVPNGNLQMAYGISPICATNQSVTWSVLPSSTCATATISGSGMLQSLGGNGVVTVVGTSVSNGSAVDRKIVTISGQNINVSSVSITNINPNINTPSGTLQMTNSVLPTCAANPNVTWSVIPSACASGTISGTGLLQSTGGNGIVTVVCTSVANGSAVDRKSVTISGQNINISGVTITNVNPMITIQNGTLQMTNNTTPPCASNPAVTWSVSPSVTCADATISGSGMLQSKGGNGVVTVICTSVANGSAIDRKTVSISGQSLQVSAVNITNSTPAINSMGGSLQMTASVLPTCATNTGIVWTLLPSNNCASGTISGTGMLQSAGGNGTITVVGTSAANSAIKDVKEVAVSSQSIAVTNVTITNNILFINTQSGILNMAATVLPVCATDKSLIWSINPATGIANIDAGTGVLQAVGNGLVTIRATSNSNGSVFNEKIVTVSGQCTPINSLNIVAPGNNYSISTDKGTLSLSVSHTPASVCNASVAWSVVGMTGCANATISGSGVLKSLGGDGTVTVMAASVADGSITAQTTVNITGHTVSVQSISITPPFKYIFSKNGVIAFSAYVLPACATDKSIIWTLENGDGKAEIDQNTGLFTATGIGVVKVLATSIQNTGVEAFATVTILGQSNNTGTYVAVESISISPVSNTQISQPRGTLQFTYTVNPNNATNSAVTWSILSVSGMATVNPNTGLVTAQANGKVIVFATSQADNSITASYVLTISGQIETPTSLGAIPQKGVIIYPNPNSGIFMMVADNIKGPVTIYVYDESGKEVYTEKVRNFDGTKELNLSHLPKALYKVCIALENGVYYKLISIQ
ncbi:MAG: Ig-like domain-containing protein [Cytophagales bacterium]|nr:Ig-like domain-containing protein [Cytophagales bacterium]